MNQSSAKQTFLGRFNALTGRYPVLSALTVFLFMLILQIAVTLSEGGSLWLSWLNILRNNVYSGIIALGMCFVILSGGIDISVGSMMCALGTILMVLIEPNTGLFASFGLTGIPAFVLAILFTLLCGFALGSLNGVLIAYGRMPAFIVTLGTMKIFRSVTQQLTVTFNPTVPEGFKAISSARIGGEVILPIIYWVVIVAFCAVLSSKTAFGKHCVAIGSAEKATALSGVNVRAKKLIIYGISGLTCAVAAVLYVSRIGTMDFANTGSGYEMDAIAAAIIGGTSMSGGKGSPTGAFIGMLIIGLMNNILNSVGIPTFLCEAVKGIIIIVAVLMQKKETA